MGGNINIMRGSLRKGIRSMQEEGTAAQSLAAERGKGLRIMGDSKSPMGPESKFLPEGYSIRFRSVACAQSKRRG